MPSAAHAGSIPTYTITQGSIITVGINGFTHNPDVVYQFSGSGFSVVGFGQIVTDFGAALGIFLPPGFGPLDPGLSLFTDPSDGGAASGTIGGVSYSSLLFNPSLFLISGPSFNLTSENQSAVNSTLPITFSGTASACVFDPTNPQNGCVSSIPGNFIFNGKGTATINYVNQGGLWVFNSATFTLPPVPEPGTFLLLGSGLTALLGVVRRRRALARQD